jgi:hypothetical protein
MPVMAQGSRDCPGTLLNTDDGCSPGREDVSPPTKEHTVELTGEISADHFMDNEVNRDEIKVGVCISEMIENYTNACFEDLARANPKTLAPVNAGISRSTTTQTSRGPTRKYA